MCMINEDNEIVTLYYVVRLLVENKVQELYVFLNVVYL